MKSSQLLAREGLMDMTCVSQGESGPFFGDTKKSEQVVKQHFLEARKQPCQYWEYACLTWVFPGV